MNEEEIVEVCADPEVTVFEDIEEKVAKAKVSELLAMRKKALAEAKETERVLRQGEIDGAIPWCEDASIIYDYQMRLVSACSLRLAKRYAELEQGE